MVGGGVAEGFDGSRLTAARRKAGLTQQKLADQLGVPNTTISKWESGLQMPYAASVRAVADALGVEARTLFSPSERSETLAKLRVEAGLSQPETAKALSMVRSTYSAIERGEIAVLDESFYPALAGVLGVSVDRIKSAYAVARRTHHAGR